MAVSLTAIQLKGKYFAATYNKSFHELAINSIKLVF